MLLSSYFLEGTFIGSSQWLLGRMLVKDQVRTQVASVDCKISAVFLNFENEKNEMSF